MRVREGLQASTEQNETQPATEPLTRSEAQSECNTRPYLTSGPTIKYDQYDEYDRQNEQNDHKNGEQLKEAPTSNRRQTLDRA